MGLVQFSLVSLMFLCDVISSENTCADKFSIPEKRLFNNLDNLIQQSHVEISPGVTLRKKTELQGLVANNTMKCDGVRTNFLRYLIEKVGGMVKTHVVEFNLGSILTNGNNY